MMSKKIKKYYHLIVDRFPSRLPDGMTALEKWTQSLIDTYDFPDNASVRFMLAAMIMQTGPEDAYVPKRKFALMGLAAASKEVAHARLVELKEAQQAKAADEAKAAAAANGGTPPLAKVAASPAEAADVGRN
jgi:hypothetical protein